MDTSVAPFPVRLRRVAIAESPETWSIGHGKKNDRQRNRRVEQGAMYPLLQWPWFSPGNSSLAQKHLKEWSADRITLRYIELAHRCDSRVYQLYPHLVCDYLVMRRQASFVVTQAWPNTCAHNA